eukprot:CAMPEP_0194687468 /NCGR_PEP_ID=MMETSP0295-20121207/16257_1 /TAXON_ID=39354 /ORGANISM="Heterosigma akashiwo, Strain CCMP2393" /LENGTH=181 /DNA_ID=CAMNT_0039575771 /DNA_START=618 /DNA_END=1161 /DNA_ORIENTATION=-
MNPLASLWIWREANPLFASSASRRLCLCRAIRARSCSKRSSTASLAVRFRSRSWRQVNSPWRCALSSLPRAASSWSQPSLCAARWSSARRNAPPPAPRAPAPPPPLRSFLLLLGALRQPAGASAPSNISSPRPRRSPWPSARPAPEAAGAGAPGAALRQQALAPLEFAPPTLPQRPGEAPV